MNNIDIKSLKILIFIVAICLLFLVTLPYLYRNIPETNNNLKSPYKEINTVTSENNNEIAPSENTISEQASDTTEESPKEPNKLIKIEKLPDISTINQIENTVENIQKESDIFKKANELRNAEKYESAVYEYQQISKTTDNNLIKAKCEEEIALTYASIRRYETALKHAQISYKIVPTLERELLLARLYYKTGNYDIAKDSIDKILKRDIKAE